MQKVHPLVKEVLFDNETLKNRIAEVAKEVEEYYSSQTLKDNTLIIIGLLKGCVPFMQEFLLNYNSNCETEYMAVSSYNGGTKSNNKPNVTLDIKTNVKGKDLIILDDIIDTGTTLKYIKESLYDRGAKSVKIVTLLDKVEGREVDIKPDWTCFVIEKKFIIGFGLDYQEKLRNLPYVAICDTDKLKDWKW